MRQNWAAPYDFDAFYHVYNRGNQRRNIFFAPADYQLFLNRWKKYIHPVAETHAYCLLPNHFHAVVRIRGEAVLQPLGGLKSADTAFKNLFIAFARSMQERYRLHGNLFHRPYRRKVIVGEDALRRSIAYVMMNARKHGLVNDMAQYAYASYRSLSSGAPTLLERDAVLALYGGKIGLVDYLTQWSAALLESEEMEED